MVQLWSYLCPNVSKANIVTGRITPVNSDFLVLEISTARICRKVMFSVMSVCSSQFLSNGGGWICALPPLQFVVARSLPLPVSGPSNFGLPGHFFFLGIWATSSGWKVNACAFTWTSCFLLKTNVAKRKKHLVHVLSGEGSMGKIFHNGRWNWHLHYTRVHILLLWLELKR